MVGEKEAHRRDPKKVYGVVKGEKANNSGSLGLHAHIGLATSKWYVFEYIEYLYEYHDRSGTGVLDVMRMVAECDTKKEAVQQAERRCEEVY